MSDLICKFCGFDLVHYKSGYTAVDRDVTPRSVDGQLAMKGECLNAAGNITLHHPNGPDYNGGVDYSLSLPLGQEWEA